MRFRTSTRTRISTSIRTSIGAASIPVLLLLLTSCTATGTESATSTRPPTASATVSPKPVASPGAPDRDTTLIIKVTATAQNGAALGLEMRVHQSIPFDDIAGQTLPLAVAQSCADTLSPTIFTKDRWSFTRANITAVPTALSTADWPSTDPIDVRPSAGFAAVTARGILVDDGVASDASPSCNHNKIFTSAGAGAIAIGIAGDTAADGVEGGAEGGFTRWAHHPFGFDTSRATGVTLSECTFEVTPLGAKYNGGNTKWSSVHNATTCVTGASTETRN